MKRIFALLMIAAFFMLTACSNTKAPENNSELNAELPIKEMHGVWLSCYELKPMFADGTEESFEKAMSAAVGKCAENSINALFVQVRPFCDAFYPSEVFGWSKYALSSDGKAPDYDPLEITVRLAHAASIEVHAWVNPYRVTYSTDYSSLAAGCPAVSAQYKSCTVVTDSGIYFDPSAAAAQSLVLDGIREILTNYDVDGIHIDDYFYPTASAAFDAASYSEYCALGGEMPRDDWRRNNVNELMAGIYALVKTAGKDKVFSISPAADIEKNRNQYYADVALWGSEQGYADIIIPQIYFGFKHETMQFEAVERSWAELVKCSSVRLVCGLAAYKQGVEDSLAGSGKNEWIDDSSIIDRQIAFLSSDSKCSGYVLFSFNYSFK